MKKGISFLWILLFLVNYLQAQPTEKLTNSTILKMVKAKLSDDLIIGEINALETNFNVSPDSINYLSSEKVSPSILQVMKAAYEKQSPQTLIEPEIKTPVQQVNIPVKEPEKKPEVVDVAIPVKKTAAETVNSIADNPANVSVSKVDINSSISVEAMSYTIPITDLMLYFDQEFSALSKIIYEWNEQAVNSLEHDSQLRKNLSEVDDEITKKKNADSKALGSDFAKLKTQRAVERANVQQYKKKMLTDGMNITRKLKEMGNDMDNTIGNRFSTVSNSIRSTNADPSAITIKPLTIAHQQIKENIIHYIYPVTDLLHFCQNEILSLKEIILQKNQDIVSINQKDKELARQMEPLQQKMVTLQENAKKNKKEISGLKKKSSELEKERKALSQQMEKNSKELSKQMEELCKNTQATLGERFAEIIDNINYLYVDSFTGN